MEKAKPKRLNIAFESGMDSHNAKAGKKSGGGKPTPPNTKGLMWQFIAIASVPLVLVLGNSMLVPVLPEMMSKLGITRFQSSLVISLFSITAAFVIPIAGYLSDRFTRKAVLIPALIVYGGAGILAGFGAMWGSYAILISARAIQGIGAAGTSPIAMALCGDLFKGGTESKALGLTEASNGFGKVISPVLGSLLALIAWYMPFFAFPLFCLVSLLFIMFLIKEPKKDAAPASMGQYVHKIGTILKKKGRWLISAFFAGSIALFILFGTLFYLSNILEDNPYNIDGVAKGGVLAIPLLGMVATSYITGSVIKKNGTLMRWLMNIGMASATISYGLLIFFYSNLYVLIGLLTLGSIGTGLVLPCLNTIITGSVDKSERGMITSLYNSLRFLGVAFGPPLFGWMMDQSNRIVFMSVTAVALVTLGLVFFLIKPQGKVA